MVREWHKYYDKLLAAHFGKGKKYQKLYQGAKVISHELNVAVFKYLEERSERRVVHDKQNPW